LLETQRTFSRADLRNELAVLDLPALVIQGGADRSAPLELTGRRTAALVPGSRLVVIDGAGHGLYTGDAARYNAELIGFARTCSPTGGPTSTLATAH
jgi:pimeloyl-ACP methyl ester carboxylesterase